MQKFKIITLQGQINIEAANVAEAIRFSGVKLSNIRKVITSKWENKVEKG